MVVTILMVIIKDKEKEFAMKKTGKIVSIALSVVILMQIFAVTSFAEQKEMTWALQPVEGEITMPKYHGEYSDELGVVFISSETHKYGTIDKHGNTLIPAEYDNILYYYGNEYVHVMKYTEGNYGRVDAVVNAKGEFTIDFGTYARIDKINDDAIVAKKGEKYGLVAPSGEILADFIYDEIIGLIQNQYLFENIEYVCAKKDGKYGVIDYSGKVIIPFEHDYRISLWLDGKFYKVEGTVSKEPYYLDTNGSVVDSSVLKQHAGVVNTYIDGYYISDETTDRYIVQKDGGFGLTDKNMKLIIPCNYNVITANSYGDFFYAKEKDTPGTQGAAIWFDKQGNPIEYLNKYNGSPTKSGYVIGIDKESECVGMADSLGNVLIPFEYSHIWEIGNGLYAVKTNTGKEGIAEFGTGTKLTDTFEGLILKIDSKTATAFNKEAKMDVAPIIKNGRTMLPARFVAENLGAEVSWDAETQTVTISLNSSHYLQITIGSDEAKVGGYRPYIVKLDAPAFIENGRTYTPVRFIAESLGAKVFWQQDTQTVKILKK